MTDRRGDMESRIEEALMRRSTDVEPEPGAWNGVRDGVRRAHRVRIAVSSVAALALIGAGIFVVPKLVGRDNGATPVIPGPTATSPAPSVTPPAVPANWSVLRYDEQSYWLTIPDAWRTGWFEGHAEYRPPGLKALAVGEDTFALETYVVEGSAPAPDGTPESVTINGRTAQRWESIGTDGSHTITYEIALPCTAWPGRAATPGCITALRATIFASTAALWDEHGAEGEQAARSIHPANATMPGSSYRTLNGSATVEWNARTWAVVQFMESRIFGDTARGDVFLTANAKQQYDNHEGGLDRYDPNSSRRMVTYVITGRSGADAASDEFTVRITEAGLDGSKPQTTYTETLGVGPAESNLGRTEFQIRFATRNAG